jgi:hypothetical protein
MSADAFCSGNPGQAGVWTPFNAFGNEGLSSVGWAGFTPDDPLNDA